MNIWPRNYIALHKILLKIETVRAEQEVIIELLQHKINKAAKEFTDSQSKLSYFGQKDSHLCLNPHFQIFMNS